VKRAYLTKIMLLIIFVLAFFLISWGSKDRVVIARDLSASVLWSGEDIAISPLQEIDYESPYIPFEVIIDHHELIDNNQIYVIEKATDLYHLSRLSMSENRHHYLSLNYVLGQSIDYYDAIIENMDYRFYPIGAIDAFSGTFDGQGFEITNLYFQTVMDEDTYDLIYSGMRHMAMFSKLSQDAHVHHFGLINPIMIQPIEWRTWRYAAYVAGENLGTLDHIYVIDTRQDGAGLHVDGAFHLAGLVSVNKGMMRDMWYASPSVRSRAVTHALSASPTVSENTGVLDRVYYDQSMYVEETPLFGLGLSTPSFQQRMYFSDEWFFNDHYVNLASDNQKHLVTLNRVYPTLQGLKVRGTELLVSKPSDVLVMQNLLLRSPLFRQATYVLTHDLDMRSLSKDAYKPSAVSFDGTLKSDVIQSEHTLYDHHPSDGGSPMHYSILYLSLTQVITQNNRDIMSFLGVLFGEVKDLNFRRLSITYKNMKSTSEELMISPLVGEQINGTIRNVHVQLTEGIIDGLSHHQKVVFGGLVASATGIIDFVSTTGHMPMMFHLSPQASLVMGGIAGVASQLSVDESSSQLELTIPNIQKDDVYDLVIGGIIGKAVDVALHRVIFEGTIEQTHDMEISRQTYLAGILGYGENDIQLNLIVSKGVIVYLPLAESAMYVSGIANLYDAAVSVFRVLHEGQISSLDPQHTSEEARHLTDVHITFGLHLQGSTLQSIGLFNTSSTSLNLSFIDRYAGLIIALSSDNTSIIHSENRGHITGYTTEVIASPSLNYHGLFDLDEAVIEHARHLGNITIHVSHATSLTYAPEAFNVGGILSNLGDSSSAMDLFNGGNLTLTTSDSITFHSILFMSGILSRHRNRAFSVDHGIIPSSITFDQKQGPLHNVLNAGDLSIRGSFDNHVYAAGITSQQEGLITQAINLGDIEVINTSNQTSKTVQAGGIANVMIGQHARILDSANAGQIEAIQLSPLGFAHASGIAVRNDLNHLLEYAPTSDNNHYAKILFTINYGDVYAWSETDETSYTMVHETHAKAAGILAIGVLSIINNVNYGTIHGKYLASGLIGFLPLNRFGTLQKNEVYIANAIQYGRIKAIEHYDLIEDSYVNKQTLPSRTVYNAYGSMVGKIHTGTQTWAFAGNVTYPIDGIYFGYLLNMDPTLNMFANAPELSSSWADGFGNLQEANNVILNMLAYMATTNPNDQSKAPFTYFYQGGWIGQYMGKVIQHYTITENDNGMFYEGFAFREKRPVYTGTDQYIRSYIDYVTRDKVNPYLLNHLEEMYQTTFPGIYALSSSEGIGQGIFMPDNMEIDHLHPINPITFVEDPSWLGEIADPLSIRYQLEYRMRQIQNAFASVIYDLELEQKDAFGQTIQGGLKLTSPEIDESRGLITYYLPSNASVLFGQSEEMKSVYRFIEVSEGLGRKVPDLIASGTQTYTWVGNYKKQGNDFVQIGPYHTTGVAMVTTNDLSPVDSYSRNTPVYSRQTMEQGSSVPYIYKHTPHTYVVFVWYASGYRASVTTGLTAGYGAYEPYSLSGYPTLYRYVGPSKEAVTYIRSEQSEEVAVFGSSNVYFGVNTNPNTSVLSYGASLTYQGALDEELTTIPRSYGIYEAMYDLQGHYVDSVTDHYGRIRVYSNAYQPEQIATYRDYTIRIIRTAPQSILDITSLTLNDQNVMPASYTVNHIEASTSLQALAQGEVGTFKITYQTYNIANRYSLLPSVRLVHSDLDEDIPLEHYALKQGHVTTMGAFENRTGLWKEGVATIELIIYETLPSGDYTFILHLVTGESYHMHFNKAQSSMASIQSMTYAGKTYDQVGSTLEHTIPYGLFYDPLIPSTNMVNFTNLSMINMVSYDELSIIKPSYVDAITLERFAMIEKMALEIEHRDTGGYRYIITYDLLAEDGSSSQFRHILNEANPHLDPDKIYMNGRLMTESLIKIQYNESPSLRITYLYRDAYIYPDQPWSLDVSFEPIVMGEVALDGVDYHHSIKEGIGFDIDWSKDTPMGQYTITPIYRQTVMRWNMTFDWELTYQPIIVHKVMNDQSHMTDILFVSDAVFQGFNTIIETELITYEKYQTLLNTPSLRQIIHLPTTGILYGDHDHAPTYYIIGQVQKTELSYYGPQFFLPNGAIIRRVIDEDHIDPSYQSEVLYTDFTAVGETFRFIHYRVYAMDYAHAPTHYTDYYVAVQDMTNTIRFDITIQNQATIAPTSVYVKINLCQTGSAEDPQCNLENRTLSMGWYAHYQQGMYTHPVFQTTSYGSYTFDVVLPQGYQYRVVIQEVTLIGDAYYVEHSIFPRKIYVTLIIEDKTTEIPWGQHENYPLIPIV